jgi:calcineurin-like phosphoesterase family protein
MGYRIRDNGFNFLLTHYPTLCSNYDGIKSLKKQVINLCGHTHTKDPFEDWDKGLIFHCEMDTNKCAPWSLTWIESLLVEKYKSR